MSEPTFNRDKLREAILYVARRSECDPEYGKTKLFKILFFGDFGLFASRGRAITGARYQKYPRGPVPHHAWELLSEMEQAGELAIAQRSHFGHTQQRPVALREPDLSHFQGEEIAALESAMEDLRGLNASDVSRLSHHFVGWKAAREYENIPYATALIDTSPPTEAEEEFAAGLVLSGR